MVFSKAWTTGAGALRRLRGARFTVRLPVLNLCVTLWLLAVLNGPFWQALWQAVGGLDSARTGFLISLPLLLVLWVWLTLEALTWGRAARPVLGAVIAISAATAYFMHAYGIAVDRTMIANLLETHPAEVRELLSARMLPWLVFLVIAPLWLLSRLRIVSRPWHVQLLTKGTTIAALATGIILVLAPFFQSYAPLVRNHRELRLQLVPSNYLAAVHSYAKVRFAASRPLEIVADDARRAAAPPRAKPSLTLIVIGETARAANFGLNGYARATTPELAAQPEVINFTHASSCGTSTAVSLPCMFLDTGRSGFSDTLAMRRENVLDVLQRVGFSVWWRDNNSGCKGICDRVAHEDLSHAAVPGVCAGDECYDEILLHGLQERLDSAERDTVIVLHMKGSHGPAYYLRYPTEFEHFKPVCRTNELDRCERETIVNAYDNTLRYTDHVLAGMIGLMRRNSGRFDAWMLYVSDHGESLGEHGIYLHGAPYPIAPAEQTRVPMVLWLSAGARERFGVDDACLRGKSAAPVSHDNLYHSTLGLLGVETRTYRAHLDIFRDCRRARDPAGGAPGPLDSKLPAKSLPIADAERDPPRDPSHRAEAR